MMFSYCSTGYVSFGDIIACCEFLYTTEESHISISTRVVKSEPGMLRDDMKLVSSFIMEGGVRADWHVTCAAQFEEFLADTFSDVHK